MFANVTKFKAVYLVSVVDNKWVSWNKLCDRPTHFGDKIVFRGQISAHKTWFTAVLANTGCELKWCDAPYPSPFLNDSITSILSHGDQFSFANKIYIVWCVELSHVDTGVASNKEISALNELAILKSEDLLMAAYRFLELPEISDFWYKEFVEKTGFIQCRGGKVPKVKDCVVNKIADGYELQSLVTIWDLFAWAWVEGSKVCSFSKKVSGNDLIKLRDCATILSKIPVIVNHHD